MIEVFKTDVENKVVAQELSIELSSRLSASSVSFDLEDCDKVLRIESSCMDPWVVIHTLKRRGFNCEVLE